MVCIAPKEIGPTTTTTRLPIRGVMNEPHVTSPFKNGSSAMYALYPATEPDRSMPPPEKLEAAPVDKLVS